MRILSLILCLFLSCQVYGADETYRLMVFGDSLSVGHRLPVKDSFYRRLEDALHDKGYKNVTVLNASKSGETTAGGLKRVANALNKKPDAVILELGSNDAIAGTSISTIQKNLESIITSFRQKNVPVMLIGMRIPPFKDPAYSQQFTAMYNNLAKKYNLILYPYFMKDVIRIRPVSLSYDTTYVLNDNVHPNAKGVQLMVKNVLPDVIKFLNQNGVRK